MLALWIKQRQGDLLRLTWGAYDGQHIRFRQSKTRRNGRVRVSVELKAVLDAAKAVNDKRDSGRNNPHNSARKAMEGRFQGFMAKGRR